MAVLSERDRGAWRRLAGRVAEVLEPRLSERVLANRAVGDRAGWSLGSLGATLRRARHAAERLAGGMPLLVRTDVREFYPSVDPSVLFACLRSVGVGAGDAGAASDLVEGWGSEGYAGLPIGPPGSAVMANAVLAPLDGALAGLAWLRWCDDLLIGIRSTTAVDGTLDRVDVELQALGLHRSTAKTAVQEGGTFRWPGDGSSGLR